MDLLTRYLHAVNSSLPQLSKDDIIAELAEDLYCQAESQKSELVPLYRMTNGSGILKSAVIRWLSRAAFFRNAVATTFAVTPAFAMAEILGQVAPNMESKCVAYFSKD